MTMPTSTHRRPMQCHCTASTTDPMNVERTVIATSFITLTHLYHHESHPIFITSSSVTLAIHSFLFPLPVTSLLIMSLSHFHYTPVLHIQ